jgi:hypothetical protein
MAELMKQAVRALSRGKNSSLDGSARGSFGGPEDRDPRIPDGDECRDRAALTAEQRKTARARAGVAPKHAD